MKVLLILTVALLAACENPQLNAGISLGANGLTVRPSVSGNVGGLGVEVTP